MSTADLRVSTNLASSEGSAGYLSKSSRPKKEQELESDLFTSVQNLEKDRN